MRTCLLLGLLLRPALSMDAQTTSSVLAGLSASKVVESNGNVSVSTDTRAGFVVGLELASPIAKGIAFTPQLLYAQKGFGAKDETGTFRMRISYIEVPVLVRADIGTGRTRPFVFGGAHMAFKVGCSVSAETDTGSASADCEAAFGGDKLKSTDVGVTVGAGVKFRHFSLSARYDVGFSNIAVDADPGDKVRNRSFLFLASFVVK